MRTEAKSNEATYSTFSPVVFSNPHLAPTYGHRILTHFASTEFKGTDKELRSRLADLAEAVGAYQEALADAAKYAAKEAAKVVTKEDIDAAKEKVTKKIGAVVDPTNVADVEIAVNNATIGGSYAEQQPKPIVLRKPREGLEDKIVNAAVEAAHLGTSDASDSYMLYRAMRVARAANDAGLDWSAQEKIFRSAIAIADLSNMSRDRQEVPAAA